MPGQGKYTTYVPEQRTTSEKGKSNTTLLKNLFNPPVEISDHGKIVELGNQYLLANGTGGVQAGDPNHFASSGGVVNLNYEGSPDYVDEHGDIVKSGDKGNPSTSYTPNLTSPGVANGVSPDGQKDMGVDNDAGKKILNSTAVEGINGLRNPVTDASTMGSTSLSKDSNPLVPGKHPGA